MDDHSGTGDREIVITRVFDAPRELVFAAWTDRQHIGRWFGPTGFTTTIDEMDVRPGGVWRFTMHGPDGTDFPNWIHYREVQRPERLVYDQGGETPEAPVQFRSIVTFADQAGKTLVTLRSIFPTKEARDFVVQRYGAIEGGHQTLARLAEHLAAPQVLIVRDFAAPRDVVFAAWTSQSHLERWFAPTGCTLVIRSLDFRRGGRLATTIITPTGYECRCLTIYRDIVAPELIVFTMANVDADDRPADPAAMGMDPEWPGETTVTVTFSELGEGRTRLTLHQTAPEAVAKRTGAHAGWLLMLDRLTELVR